MSKRLNDQFSHLAGTVSRQRLYQWRKAAAGGCQVCGQPAAPGMKKCVRCLVAARERARNRSGAVRRYDCKSARLEKEAKA